MKLYNSDLSPFEARCRMQLRAKHLPVELAAPPADRSAVNPVGKIPEFKYCAVAVTAGGTLREAAGYGTGATAFPALRGVDMTVQTGEFMIDRKSVV